MDASKVKTNVRNRVYQDHLGSYGPNEPAEVAWVSANAVNPRSNKLVAFLFLVLDHMVEVACSGEHRTYSEEVTHNDHR